MVTEETKQAVDVFAASTGAMSLAAWLPPVASIFTIIWLGIRIYESETVQNIVHATKGEGRARQYNTT
jgi:hypothetical protein